MKLYYSKRREHDRDTHGQAAEPWQLPGKQDKSAERVDIPNQPEQLAAWLNERQVPAIAGDAPAPQLSGAPDEGRFWEVGPPTKDPPRVSPAFLGDLESGATFVPISRSAEIAASYHACPKCQRTWTAQVIMGIAEAPIDDLQRIAESIKHHVAELREGIDEGTRQ